MIRFRFLFALALAAVLLVTVMAGRLGHTLEQTAFPAAGHAPAAETVTLP